MALETLGAGFTYVVQLKRPTPRNSAMSPRRPNLPPRQTDVVGKDLRAVNIEPGWRRQTTYQRAGHGAGWWGHEGALPPMSCAAYGAVAETADPHQRLQSIPEIKPWWIILDEVLAEYPYPAGKATGGKLLRYAPSQVQYGETDLIFFSD